MRRIAVPVLAFGIACMAAGCGRSEDREAGEEGRTVLSVWVRSGYSQEQGLWRGDGAQRLSEELGLTLSFQVEDTSRDQKLLQYLASGTLPDLIVLQGGDEAKLLMDAGLLQPFDEFAGLMPNIFGDESRRQAIEASRTYLGNGEGELVLLPAAVGTLAKGEYGLIPGLRWLAYRNAGCPPIKTLEDYIDVVEEMKRNMPYTYAGREMIGFSLSGELDVYALSQVCELGYLYGIDMEVISPLMETNLADRTTVSIFREDSFYKRGLHFYFEANRRGLLDRDSRTQTRKSLRDKYEAGDVLFGVLEDQNVDFDLTARDFYVPAIAPDMRLYRVSSLDFGNGVYFAVNSGSSHAEDACRFLNWLYTPDHLREFDNGLLGGIWDYGEDGAPYVTEAGWEKLSRTEEESPAVLRSAGFPAGLILKDGYTLSWRYWDSSGGRLPEAPGEEIKAYLGGNTVEEYLERSAQTVEADPAIYLLPPLPEKIREKMEAIGETTCRLSWDMIYAESEEAFEALWEEMCRTAKANGMDEVEAYYRDILSRLP